MVLGRHFLLKQHFEGLPKESDFDLVEEELGELQDGDIVFEAEAISVDPYQRPYSRRLNPPTTMLGSQVGLVVESRGPSLPVGTRIVSYSGWAEKGRLPASMLLASPPASAGLPPVVKAPEILGLPATLLLGACGMPGNTAYFGLLELCKPKAGETVVVNGAAGAVGSLVGQIAKIKGCKVIGFAGDDDKVKWLKEELCFDHAFNYKKISMEASLSKAAPGGVDCFFDNVGGPDSSVVLSHMNARGRVAVCGAIASYNDDQAPLAPAVQWSLIDKEITMEGFQVSRWVDRWDEGIAQMANWIKEGKIKAKETIVHGFENAPKAFIGLFAGSNTGKMVVSLK